MCKSVLMAGLLLSLAAAARAVEPSQSPASECCQAQAREPNAVDTVLKNLQERAQSLKSYQARIDYTVRQPLLESQQRRTGVLYYARTDKHSNLRIDFQTLQQDEEEAQKYLEQFFFDGVWLWHVDHQTRHVDQRQMAEPNEPIDAFALASRQVPVIGFSKMEDLRRQFEVSLVPPESPEPAPAHHLHLKARPDSAYKDDYVTIDFWIDKKLGLPARVVAVTTEEDIHEIRLVEAKVNAGVDPEIFQVYVPRGFSTEVIPLERKTREK